MIEFVRRLQIPFVAGEPIDLDQRFEHAAVLGLEHLLDLFVAHRGEDPIRPIREFDQHLQRLLTPRQFIGIYQPGIFLVQPIPRHVSEALGQHDVTPRKALKNIFRHATHKTAAGGLLSFRHISNNSVHPLLESLIGFSMYQGVLAIGKIPTPVSLDEILQKMILPTDLLHSYPVTVKK